ncbi:MAG: hypothetical protein HYX63_01620 [Gammaproteobacteria bacterium]|nr:hypothetical protein [Gammaproteobacteria bacterium]
MLIRPTEEQIAKLQTLCIKLADIFLDEADPDKWPSLTSNEDRGNRYWMKKNAGKTLAMVSQMITIGNRLGGFSCDDAALAADAENDDQMKNLIRDAEIRAAKYLAQHGKQPTH